MDTNENKKCVAVVGLGYVGLPLTAALANVGYHVIGVDIDKKRLERLKQSYKADIYEPGVDDVFNKCRDCIEFTSDYGYAMGKCEAVFVTVGTPLKDNDEPDYGHIDASIVAIGKHLKKGQTVVLKSTVVVGTTEDHVKPKLEKISGLKAGTDFYLAFCPERTIEGLALHELYNLPKIVGGINKESGEEVAELVGKLGSKVSVVSKPRVAEMCKLLDNLYRSMNIAFANEVGMVCERIGIDANEVVSAVNSAYARTNLFRPGLGADGPCLSKDPLIFRYSAHKHGILTEMTDSCVSTNVESTLRISSIAQQFIAANKIEQPRVALVGLAFKGFPETDDVRGSPALKIKKALGKENDKIVFSYYDPLVKEIEDNKVEASISACVKDCDVVMFLTNHPRIMNVDAERLTKGLKTQCLIIDAWRNVNNIEKLGAEVQIFRIGVGK